ncbi:MAG: glycoside hydrolase family 2 TIM barrel-domain containing protein [Lachnospiraceae bacterium]
MKLFNDGWEFSKQPLGTDYDTMEQNKSAFAPVGIPHDWLIGQADLYEDGTGWYRRLFTWNVKEGELVFLRFDGIYMDSRVYLNGHLIKEWKYGYSTFEADLTPWLKNGENDLRVSVAFQAPNSRWYSGAGIYRNVWLKTVPIGHMVSDGIYFSAEPAENGVWAVDISTEVVNFTEYPVLEYRLVPAASMVSAGENAAFSSEVLAGEERWEMQESGVWVHHFHARVKNPQIWDTGHPACYVLETVLKEDGKVLQTEKQMVGFRTVAFLPDQGFLLNGRKVKLNGVCEHHDLGCLGAAFHRKAMERKFRILKEMGVNAVRLSHNMPAPELMELADEMGILVVSESFDMWESCKTPYDYGRFFKEWYREDVASWVRRDRNHPSLIMWSIGNEIYDTHVGDRGQYWTKVLMEEVRKHDGRGNGAITIGSNYMPWENAQKCADIIKTVGYNYGEKYYEAHHREHPDWVIYGSETGSVVQSRGIYHFPYSQSVLADEDEQCSSLGNSTTSWGAPSTEACIRYEIEHPYSCGQFIWTGFDYIGEPTPYHTRNSYFGQIDTAGFPKDSYYIYQAAWTDYREHPMVHVFPYWDFNEGQLIDVRVCSNAPVVELFVNGKSQGTFSPDLLHGVNLTGHWQIPYEEGEIRAVACDEDGTILAEEVRHSFGDAARICLKPSEASLCADGEDLLFLEISTQDENGYPVENDCSRVRITAEGAGMLIGTDNGDSTDPDGYKDSSRRLFSGKLLAVFRADTRAGNLVIRVASEGLHEETLCIPVVEAVCREGISELAWLPGKSAEIDEKEKKDDVPVRNILLTSKNGMHLCPEKPETEICARICPEAAGDREVFWSIVDDAGIPLKIAEIQADGLRAVVQAKSDGHFRVRCTSRSGSGKIRIISSLEFEITGFGKAFTDPYEFVSAGQYQYSKGGIGNGNEHGVATARDGESQVGFRDMDFGPYGSDEITVPIFALTDDPYEIGIYEGMPDEGGELLGTYIYQKPHIWNVYQEETFHLPRRLRGVTGICFVLKAKVHIKGFRFTKYDRTWQQLYAGECDRIYGDNFIREDQIIREIGNNVTIEFGNMEFGPEGATGIQIAGSTPLENNTIILKISGDDGERKEILEFSGKEEVHRYNIAPVTGTNNISFVFLPGSNFDFKWLRFCR